MGVRMNLEGVEPQQGGGGPLPDGEYVVRIIGAVERTANSGTEGFEFEMEVLVGDYAGRKLWDRMWFTPKTAGMVRWRMECASVPVPSGDFTLEPDHFVGRRVQVVVRQESYTANDGNEKTRAEVKGWSPPPGSDATDPFSDAGDPGPTAPPHSDDSDISFAPSYI